MAVPSSQVAMPMGSLSPVSSPEKTKGNLLELTPRSKVKAMLAAIDDDSDQETPAPSAANKRSRPILATISSNVQSNMSVDQKSAAASSSETQDDSEEEESIVPRGRLAAQLKAQDATAESPASDGENEPENAYARIRKQLSNQAKKVERGVLEDEADHKASNNTLGSREVSSTSRSPTEGLSESSESSTRSLFKSMPSPDIIFIPGSERAPQTSTARASTPDDADSAHFGNPAKSNRFQELVAKKRAERKAKEAEEEQKRAEKLAKRREFEKAISRDALASDDASDDDLGERHLEQSARPTRKASKKALEEMNRETQRMNRSMQLAHQAKTKKKISKDSLFARFNFCKSTTIATTKSEHLSSSTVASSAPASEDENKMAHDSPPTSPVESPDEPLDHPFLKSAPLGKSFVISTTHEQDVATFVHGNHALELGDEDLPEMAKILQDTPPLGKGISHVAESPASVPPVKERKRYNFKQRHVRVKQPNRPPGGDMMDLDSDSDLEKCSKQKSTNSKSRSSKLDAFHRIPTHKLHEGRSLLTLRALAHLNSPDDQMLAKKSSMNVSDMQISLQKRARLQALEERKAKIDDLKARGVLVQTAEEREKDQTEVEDLLEKARREADDIQQKEKRIAKNQKVANGDTDGFDTSDEDEDYNDGEDHDADVELSGSDEEEAAIAYARKENSADVASEREEDEEGVDIDEERGNQNAFLEEQAEEDAEEEGEEEEEEDEEEEEEVEEEDDDDEAQDAFDGDDKTEDDMEMNQLPRTRRRKFIIEDEDEDDEPAGKDDPKEKPNEIGAADQARTPAIHFPKFPLMFGAADSNDLSLGMTQAFAATMAETQGGAGNDVDEEQDLVGFFGPPPEPDLPLFAAEDSQPMVQNSQNEKDNVPDSVESHHIDLQFSQSQLRYDALVSTQLQREDTQLTEIPDPTQDAGFVLSSPAPERFISVSPSTVDTVIIPEAGEQDSPVAKRRGRLVRGRMNQTHIKQINSAPEAAISIPRDVFMAMKEKRETKAAQEVFNKKKSDAKDMVEEQAAESEDEYAGLGGASDDESGGEEDAYVKEMMDHGEVDVDEGQLAAYYANKERASDEKAVEKLFKDINNGGLRRKRGADFDLSDSDDDGEARRRRKQREFAKMRKALLADEKVGEIAEDPKKLAFLRAIEDREDDEDLDFLERPAEDSFRVETMDTQEKGVDSQSQQVLDTRENSTGSFKPPLQETHANMLPPRLTARARRTVAGTTTKKPSTLAEIRESVSFLTETPGAMIAAEPSSSASEASDNDEFSHRTRRRTAPNPIVDRLTLRRTSTTSSSSSNHSRLAFYDPTATTSDGFKVPSLLRRATTNLSDSSVDKNGISTYAATERAAAEGNDKAVFKKGSKKCSVNYFTRELEKGRVVEGVERRRREEREKKAKERRSRGLGGLVGRGGFD